MTPLLNVDVSRTAMSKVLSLLDTSIFLPDVEPDNFLVEVLSPTVNRWLTYHVSKGFHLVLNGASLKMQTAKTSKNLQSLPDGVYSIRLSVTPNFSTLVEFDHLRTRQLQERYDETLCKIYSEQCSVTKKEFEEKKRELLSILMDIKAAIAKVEVGHEKKEGLELYEKASKDLKRFSNECGC